MCLCNHWRKFQHLLPIRKGISRFSRQTHNFQEKIDRTLEYCTPALLDDIIVVAGGDRKDHEKNYSTY